MTGFRSAAPSKPLPPHGVPMTTEVDGSSVREARLADSTELARLRWNFREDEQAGQNRSEFTRGFDVWFREALASGRWVVAVSQSGDGSLQGCMYLQCVEKVPVPGQIRRYWGYVTNSYVAPAWRGQGVGRRLLDLLVRAGRKRGLEFLLVWPSEEAIAFYEHAGFRSVAQVDGPDEVPPLELVL